MERRRLLLGLTGGPGSGKTYTALQIARRLGAQTVVVDGEGAVRHGYHDFTFGVVDAAGYSWPAIYDAVLRALLSSPNALIVDGMPLDLQWSRVNGLLRLLDKSPAHGIVTLRRRHREQPIPERWTEKPWGLDLLGVMDHEHNVTVQATIWPDLLGRRFSCVEPQFENAVLGQLRG